MADKKTTAATRVVPLGLSIERRLILRNELQTWQNGIRKDLEEPSKLADPERTRRLGASYQRLIKALRSGTIELPDEEARALLQLAADEFDDVEEWEETRAIHDAHRALLAVLVQDENSASPSPADRTDGRAWTTRGDDLLMESAVLQRVLHVHPARLTRSELLRELAGEEPDFGDRDAVDRAARDLGGVGLVHTVDEFITPTRAALRFHELIGGGVA